MQHSEWRHLVRRLLTIVDNGIVVNLIEHLHQLIRIRGFLVATGSQSSCAIRTTEQPGSLPNNGLLGKVKIQLSILTTRCNKRLSSRVLAIPKLLLMMMGMGMEIKIEFGIGIVAEARTIVKKVHVCGINKSENTSSPKGYRLMKKSYNLPNHPGCEQIEDFPKENYQTAGKFLKEFFFPFKI